MKRLDYPTCQLSFFFYLFFFPQEIVMMKDQLLVLFKPCLAFKLATREKLYVKRGFGDMGIWFSFIYTSNTFEKTLLKCFLKGFLLITCFNKSVLIFVMLFLWLRLLCELNMSCPVYIAGWRLSVFWQIFFFMDSNSVFRKKVFEKRFSKFFFIKLSCVFRKSLTFSFAIIPNGLDVFWGLFLKVLSNVSTSYLCLNVLCVRNCPFKTLAVYKVHL